MGGGAMRAAARLTGVTVATRGIRGITAEHLPVSSSTRGTFSVRAAATSSGDEMKLVSSQSQNPCLEIDDCVYTGGEEKVIMGSGDPMPRVVFDGAPTLQEAREATSELAVAVENAYLLSRDSVGYGNSVVGKHFSNSQVDRAKACVNGDITMAPAVPSPALKAFKLLHESSVAQNVVASIASDPNVWTAVLQNPELQEFLRSEKTSLGLSDSVPDADNLEKLSAKSVKDSSNNAESNPVKDSSNYGKSEPASVDFVQKIKVTLVDMMNNLSDFFQNLFGGKGAKVFANDDGTPRSNDDGTPRSIDDGTPRLSAENVMEASFMGLAVMAIVVILFKRG